MASVRDHWNANVKRFAGPATWTQGGAPLELRVGFAIARDTDIALANALGIGARILTIRAADADGRTPQTLDRIDVAGEELTINSVTPVVYVGELFGWRCICAGKGPEQ